jgi:uncharacterized protein (DUF1330 family)
MTAYLVLDLTVNDLAHFLPYVKAGLHRQAWGPLCLQGRPSRGPGRRLVAQRLVILQFPSRRHVQAFLTDPQAQDLFARHRSTTSRLVLVDGEP